MSKIKQMMIEGLGLLTRQTGDGEIMRLGKIDSPQGTIKFGIVGVPYLSMLFIET